MTRINSNTHSSGYTLEKTIIWKELNLKSVFLRIQVVAKLYFQFAKFEADEHQIKQPLWRNLFKMVFKKQLLSFGVNGAVDVGSEVTHKNRTTNV